MSGSEDAPDDHDIASLSSEGANSVLRQLVARPRNRVGAAGSSILQASVMRETWFVNGLNLEPGLPRDRAEERRRLARQGQGATGSVEEAKGHERAASAQAKAKDKGNSPARASGMAEPAAAAPNAGAQAKAKGKGKRPARASGMAEPAAAAPKAKGKVQAKGKGKGGVQGEARTMGSSRHRAKQTKKKDLGYSRHKNSTI